MNRAHVVEDGRQGPLSAYLNRIDQYSLLTPDEERRLALRWRRFRDHDAAERLVTGNLRFVVKIAFEYRTYGVRLLDLIQEGNLGLLVAVDRFDPGRGVRLTTYAVWWIRAYIQEYIRRSWSMVRFGTTRAEQRCFYRLRRERQRLERNGRQGGAGEAGRGARHHDARARGDRVAHHPARHVARRRGVRRHRGDQGRSHRRRSAGTRVDVRRRGAALARARRDPSPRSRRSIRASATSCTVATWRRSRPR